MSSTRKDARWQLASALAKEAGLELNDLPYSTSANLLQAADEVVVHLSTKKQQELADRWNGDVAPPE